MKTLKSNTPSLTRREKQLIVECIDYALTAVGLTYAQGDELQAIQTRLGAKDGVAS